MPVLSFDSLDAVPSEFRDAATQAEDGKLKVDLVLRKKLDEFRDNNTVYQKERDAALQSLGPLKDIVGDDPEGFKSELDELRNMKGRVQAGELKESSQVNEAVNKRTEDMRREHNDSLQKQAKETSAWRGKYDDLDRRYKQSLVTSAIRDAAGDAELGVNPAAIRDIMSRALQVYRADDNGKLTPYDGDSIIYGSTGDVMLPKEWISKLKEEAPHYFKGSQGGGSTGGSGDTGKKHGTTGYTTEQLMKMDPRKRLSIINGEKQARL